MKKKELFINHIPQIEVDDSKNIPSIIFYGSNGKAFIGSTALANAKNQNQINRDFKIDLDFVEPPTAAKNTSSRRMFNTATGEKKSAAAITSDFLLEILRHVNKWLTTNSIGKGTRILLAEPLAMELYPEWLSNYRRNLTRILGRKFVGKDFEHLDLEESHIDFMPEPFAVFQYYRYGIRHPLLAQRTKLYALVIDFGGGTFDTCIIETTKEGDISETGKNSRPLAAKSEPVGGFYVNQIIAEELFRKCVISKNESGKFNTALDLYKKWRKNELDLATAHDEYRNFINHFHESIYSIEDPKLSLCKSITDWNLDTPLSLRISIPLPKTPFSTTTELIHAPFSASELREIFIKKVWEQRLKNIVCDTLQRGKKELYGASISVILLSGGSANIRWLEKLVRRDCQGELSDAEILWLPDFQEVVAKGLAAECIRRFATEDQGGDFSSITYNRLCLILDADKSGHTVRRFKPSTPSV